jgi:hypothetical protein
LGLGQIQFSERKRIEESFQSIEASIEISVMAKTGESTELTGDRLARIDFPGVDVEMDSTTGSLDFSKSPASEPPREDSEVAPTTDWNSQSWELEDTDGMFRDLLFSVGKKIGIQRRVWDTISVVVHGYDTAVVLKAVLF